MYRRKPRQAPARISMQTASAFGPPTRMNQIAMQPEETIASPDASPSSPSIRLNALMITITQMNWNRRDR